MCVTYPEVAQFTVRLGGEIPITVDLPRPATEEHARDLIPRGV